MRSKCTWQVYWDEIGRSLSHTQHKVLLLLFHSFAICTSCVSSFFLVLAMLLTIRRLQSASVEISIRIETQTTYGSLCVHRAKRAAAAAAATWTVIAETQQTRDKRNEMMLYGWGTKKWCATRDRNWRSRSVRLVRACSSNHKIKLNPCT